jgi:membrane-associated protein
MFNPTHIVQSGGLLLITAIIFAECGLFVGFFLPGDTLLISAGVFAAQGKLPIVWLLLLVCTAAIAGDNTGYQIGRSMGSRLFKKKDSVFFRQQYVHQAEAFFEKYGSKAMLFSHLLPVMRTFVPVVAGVGKMDRRKFIFFDAIGDIAWAMIVTLFGYWFGRKIPNIDHYLTIAILLAIAFSFSPMIYHLIKAWRERRKVVSADVEKP